jgi:iron complex transport system ATP-binding protein
VQPGQHWVVLGPNGSGKTSLLKVLTGLMSPSAGQIRVGGRRYGATDWREVRQAIGLVSSALQMHVPPTEFAIETVISGRYDQLDLWAPVTEGDRRAARVQLRALGIVDRANRPWAYLSQGERQRVLIARALVARPRLLILDEPCAGLDPVARADFLAGVDGLARSPRAPTLVFVTHHVEEIMPAFTHVLVLAEGRVAAAGPRDDVLTGANLSRAFGRALQLRRSRRGWALTVAERSAR